MTEERENTMTDETELQGHDDHADDEVSTAEGTVDDESSRGDGDGSRGPEDHDSTEETEPEVFPAKVVKDLRKENARYRERAQQSDQLAQRLHVALVAQTGLLADPTDLEYAEEHLEDPQALAAAVDDLLERKPHLRARRVAGDIGQGSRGKPGGGVDLLDAMRGTL